MDKLLNRKVLLALALTIIFSIHDNWPYQKVTIRNMHGYPYYGSITTVSPTEHPDNKWLNVELVIYSVYEDLRNVCQARKQRLYFKSFCTTIREDNYCSIHTVDESNRIPALSVCFLRRLKGEH